MAAIRAVVITSTYILTVAVSDSLIPTSNMNLLRTVFTLILISSSVLSGDFITYDINDRQILLYLPEPGPEPQDIVRRFMQKLNVMKNGLLNLLPGRRTHILYPEELNINIGPNWITHGPSVHRVGEGGVSNMQFMKCTAVAPMQRGKVSALWCNSAVNRLH